MSGELSTDPSSPSDASRLCLPEYSTRARLSLLGALELSIAGEPVALTTATQRLLVLLALRGRQRRSFLAGTLWPDVSDEKALSRLRCALWRIRREHGDLVVGREQTLALSELVAVDVDELVELTRAVVDGRVPAEEIEARCGLLLDSPELLLGWYDDWVLEERDRLNQLRVRALEALADAFLDAGRRTDAFEAASAAARLDPLRESTHRALMRVHLAEGNPALARRELDRFTELLRDEVGLDSPTEAMLALAGRPSHR